MPVYVSSTAASAIKDVDSGAALFSPASCGQLGLPSGDRLVSGDPSAIVEPRSSYRPHLNGGHQLYGKMVETLPMACSMQQFFAPFHTPIRQAGCKGDSHTQATVMSPNHEREIELGEYMTESSSYHENINVDRYQGNGYDNPYDDANNAGYDAPTFYGHNQVVAAPQIDCTKVTALNKPLMSLTLETNNWRGRHPSTWSHDQAVDWIYSVCKVQNIDYEHVRHCIGDITGEVLVRLRKDEFDSRFPFGVGGLIYESLENEQRLYRPEDANSMYQYGSQLDYPSYHTFVENEMDPNSGMNGINSGIGDNVHLMNGGGGGGPVGINSRLESVMHDQLNGGHNYDNYLLPPNHHNSTGVMEQIKCEVDSDVDSNQSSNQSFVYSSSIYTQNITKTTHDDTKLQRRKPGRPPSKDKKSKNKNGQRNSRLWEFIRDLLLNPDTCPSLLKWENVDEGIFRFVQSDRVAKLWGQRKCNPRMTYEKLSRAMRTYYACQILDQVPKTGKYPKKLVYKFGPAVFPFKNVHFYCSEPKFEPL